MFCPNCGADNDDAKICQRCGFDIEHYDAMANVNFDYSFDDDEDEPKESFIKRNKKLVIGGNSYYYFLCYSICRYVLFNSNSL